MQRMRDGKLRELRLESLVRKRTALSSAAVEFKMQVRMAEENITEYLHEVLKNCVCLCYRCFLANGKVFESSAF